LQTNNALNEMPRIDFLLSILINNNVRRWVEENFNNDRKPEKHIEILFCFHVAQ
jgi:hypothetical protein